MEVLSLISGIKYNISVDLRISLEWIKDKTVIFLSTHTVHAPLQSGRSARDNEAKVRILYRSLNPRCALWVENGLKQKFLQLLSTLTLCKKFSDSWIFWKSIIYTSLSCSFYDNLLCLMLLKYWSNIWNKNENFPSFQMSIKVFNLTWFHKIFRYLERMKS